MVGVRGFLRGPCYLRGVIDTFLGMFPRNTGIAVPLPAVLLGEQGQYPYSLFFASTPGDLGRLGKKQLGLTWQG
jgi:hypothetical protein